MQFSGRKCYTVCKNTIRTSDTQYFGWRCVNCVLRTWAWLFNCMFYLGIAVPFCSAVGIRALLGCHVFYPKYCISNVNVSIELVLIVIRVLITSLQATNFANFVFLGVFLYEKYLLLFIQGQLYRSPASKTHTMTTKLNRLWRNVRHSREKFEGKPDTGKNPAATRIAVKINLLLSY